MKAHRVLIGIITALYIYAFGFSNEPGHRIYRDWLFGTAPAKEVSTAKETPEKPRIFKAAAPTTWQAAVFVRAQWTGLKPISKAADRTMAFHAIRPKK